MGFPRRLLYEGEEVVIDLRPHWWFFAGPAALLLLALVALLAATAVHGTVGDVVKWVVGIIALVALVWVVGRYLRWTTTNFVLTTDRLVYRSGVLAKRGIEIPLERVNTVFFHQSVLERLLRAGDLVIESGGERGHESFSDIPKPSLVQNEIYRQIELNQRRTSGPTVVQQGSVADELAKLDDLRRRGVLTDAEFQARKARLLESS